MSIGPTSLNRLLAARYLIGNVTSNLTSISSPMTVVQSLLAIHDASELIFCVLITERSLEAPEIDGKIRTEPTFMASARASIKAGVWAGPEAVSQALRLIDDLNRLRISFKHHGQLPDVASTYQLPSSVISLLVEICDRVLGIPLFALDASIALHSEAVREQLEEARLYIDGGDFKAALEFVSRGLAKVFWETNLSLYLVAGRVSTEDALLLSGRGIDPAAFITMQKILPECHIISEPEWNLRGTGHQGNWTLDNANFCLETCIQVALRLQSAPRMPSPQDFYDIYDDVVEIIADSPIIYFAHRHVTHVRDMALETRLKKGDKIVGRAHGRIELAPSVRSDLEMDVPLELGIFIALVNPAHSALGESVMSVFGSDTLWFKTEDVLISYQSNGRKEARDALAVDHHFE